MAFTVQADTGGTAGANAYISVDYFNAYHADRGNALSGSTGERQKAIVRATDYLDVRFYFTGIKRAREQTTEWPRLDAFDRDENLWSSIPDVVKEACAEYALVALTTPLNPSPTRDDRGQVVSHKSESVDVISESTTYSGGDSFMLPRHPAADLKLTRSGLVISGGRIRRGD